MLSTNAIAELERSNERLRKILSAVEEEVARAKRLLAILNERNRQHANKQTGA